jgi:hypothetical protein
MVVPGFGVEDILIREYAVENLHNAFALLIRKADI